MVGDPGGRPRRWTPRLGARPARNAAPPGWGSRRRSKLTPLALLPAVGLRNEAPLSTSSRRRERSSWLRSPSAGSRGGVRSWRWPAPTPSLPRTWRHNTLSVDGLLAASFVPGQGVRAADRLVTGARGCMLIAGYSVCWSLLPCWPRAARCVRRTRKRCALALWYVLVVVANPLAWTHYAILLLLPIALAARAAASTTGTTVSPAGWQPPAWC